MPFDHFLAQQFRRPSGMFGFYACNYMLKNNRQKIEWTVKLCDIREDSVVLEIGFGPGIGIEIASSSASKGKVYGLDFSRSMLRRASAHNRRLIKSGKVDLQFGSAASIPFPDNFFDRIFAVNVVYFWPEPRLELMEMARVLKPGGKAALYLTDRLSMDTTGFTNTGVFKKYTAEEFLPILQTGLFAKVNCETSTQIMTGKKVLAHCFVVEK
jgi:ubiquinone/menaquinone biosynthesis C-methylase UbiE